MALRHRMPVYPEHMLGEDERRIIPLMPEPSVLAFRAGENVAELAKTVVSKRSLTIDAAPGAGKTINFPIGLVKGGIECVVHVVPSTQLLASMSKYIMNVHKGAEITLIKQFDADVEFPRSGLVLTYANVMICYQALWHARKDQDRKICLYLDEVHESDAGMYVLRTLRNSAPGVGQYIQATATLGSGDMNKPFRKFEAKAKMREIPFSNGDPNKWDMAMTGVPWSLKNVASDFLIFVDSHEHASVIHKKFTEEGVVVHRFVHSTDPDEFMRQLETVEENRKRGGAINAMLVDTTYRSGHTYTTLARVIDLGLVRVMRPGPGGMPTETFRTMTQSEKVQGSARAARIPGMDCDYWFVDRDIPAGAIALEGYEADAACIFFRMLGYKPPKNLSGVPTFEGDVPRKIMSIMVGCEPIRRYYGPDRAMVPWPGKAQQIEEPVVGRPPSIASTLSSIQSEPVVVAAPDSGDESVNYGRPASVYTLPDHVDAAGLGDLVLDAEVFKAQGRQREERRRTELRQKESSPVVDHGRFENAFRKVREQLVGEQPTIMCGTYCYVPGSEQVEATHLYPGGVKDFLGAVEGVSPFEYARTVGPTVRQKVIKLLLDAYNSATAVCQASEAVLEAVGERMAVGTVDPQSVEDWAKKIRDMYVRADMRKKSTFSFLSPLAGRNLIQVTEMRELERTLAMELLGYLFPSVANAEDNSKAYVDSLTREPVMVENPGMSGRYRLDWAPKGFKEKLAARVLGAPPAVNVLFEEKNIALPREKSAAG